MSESNGILPTSDGHHDREDAKLAALAIRKGWKIPPEAFEAMPAEATRIWADRTRPDRARLGAMKLVQTMHRDNIDAQAKPAQTNVNVNVGVGVSVSRGKSARDRVAHLTAAEIEVLSGRAFDEGMKRLNGQPTNGQLNGHANGQHRE